MAAMHWYNAPANWKEEGGKLSLTVLPSTDFWRITHYGFIRDSGHFYYRELTGDFEATVKVSGHYKELYHQAGLMLRLNEKTWIKTGIEFVNGEQNVSAVVTREFSDWSVAPCAGNPSAIWLKLLRKGDFVQVDYSFDAVHYSLLRVAYFPTEPAVQVGLMAAAPGNESFEVVFVAFRVVPVAATGFFSAR